MSELAVLLLRGLGPERRDLLERGVRLGELLRRLLLLPLGGRGVDVRVVLDLKRAVRLSDLIVCD